jgi:hypothetical protein
MTCIRIYAKLVSIEATVDICPKKHTILYRINRLRALDTISGVVCDVSSHIVQIPLR